MADRKSAFDPKFIFSVRFSLNTSQINVDDVKYSQSVRSSIRSRDIFEAISENSEIKMRRSIQVLPLLLLLYHSKPHETIIDHYRCIYIEILREIRHFTILISESDRINFKRIVARISREIRNSKSFRCSTMSLLDDNWSAESVLVTQPIDANERMSFALCSIKIRARTENPEKLARPCRSYD